MDQQISIHRLTRTAPDGPCAQYTTQPGELRRRCCCSRCSSWGGLGCDFGVLSVHLFRSVLGVQRELPFPAAEGPQGVHPGNRLRPQSGRRQEGTDLTPQTSASVVRLCSDFVSAQTIKEAAPELTASSSEAEEEKEEHPKVDGEGDPDFSQVCVFVDNLYTGSHHRCSVYLLMLHSYILTSLLLY